MQDMQQKIERLENETRWIYGRIVKLKKFKPAIMTCVNMRKQD